MITGFEPHQKSHKQLIIKKIEFNKNNIKMKRFENKRLSPYLKRIRTFFKIS